MASSWNSAADAARDAEREEPSLAGVLADAQLIAATFTDAGSSSHLRPEASVALDVGGDDQPLFVFTMDVDLEDDLDVAEYPMNDIQALVSDLRSRIAASSVVSWAWMVTAGTRAGASHR